MMLGTSLASLGLSAGGLFLFGHAAPPDLIDALTLTGVVSAFVAICTTEALLAS